MKLNIRLYDVGILKEIRELIKREQLDPTKDADSRKKFLDMFQWEGSQIEGDDSKRLEQTIIDYNDISLVIGSTLVSITA